MKQKSLPQKLLDRWALIVTSPISAGIAGAAIGALSAKHRIKPIKLPTVSSKLWNLIRERIGRHIMSERVRTMKSKSFWFPVLASGLASALGAAGLRYTYSRALEHRLRKGEAWTPAEKRILRQWQKRLKK